MDDAPFGLTWYGAHLAGRAALLISVMYVMSNSTASDAAAESAQYDFSTACLKFAANP